MSFRTEATNKAEAIMNLKDEDIWKRKREPGHPDLETIIKRLFKYTLI